MSEIYDKYGQDGNAAALDVVRKAETAEAAVAIVKDAFGIEYVTFHMAKSIAGYHDTPYVKSTYPPEWLTRYLLRGYAAVDPVVLEGFQRVLPFHWSDLETSSVQAEFLEDAKKHGVGLSGYTVPIIDREGRRSLFSLSSAMPQKEWRAHIQHIGPDVIEAGHMIHRFAVRELYGENFFPQLGPREIECLSWTAQGKDSPAIAMILGLSDHTVRAYLRSVRHKLCCSTLSQAVAKAIQLRIITP